MSTCILCGSSDNRELPPLTIEVIQIGMVRAIIAGLRDNHYKGKPASLLADELEAAIRIAPYVKDNLENAIMSARGGIPVTRFVP